jgi:hypothetical protein
VAVKVNTVIKTKLFVILLLENSAKIIFDNGEYGIIFSSNAILIVAK